MDCAELNTSHNIKDFQFIQWTQYKEYDQLKNTPFVLKYSSKSKYNKSKTAYNFEIDFKKRL